MNSENSDNDHALLKVISTVTMVHSQFASYIVHVLVLVCLYLSST